MVTKMAKKIEDKRLWIIKIIGFILFLPLALIMVVIGYIISIIVIALILIVVIPSWLAFGKTIRENFLETERWLVDEIIGWHD